MSSNSKKIPNIKCNVCHKKINKEQIIDKDFIEIKQYWGYFTSRDQQFLHCIICEECWDRIEEYIETLGGKVDKYRYDMLSGEILGTEKSEIEKVKKQNAKHKNR